MSWRTVGVSLDGVGLEVNNVGVGVVVENDLIEGNSINGAQRALGWTTDKNHLNVY